MQHKIQIYGISILNLSKPFFLGNDLRKTYLNSAFLFGIFAKTLCNLYAKENNNQLRHV